MNAAALYQRANYAQRRDAQDILNEYANIIQWRNDDDTLMDIGCGSGDVTIDFILPLMPKNYKNLIGTDISKEMIRYASKNYEKSSLNILFEVMDISDDLNDKYRNKFDHITSFYCLHWVQNQKKAIQNISDMLNTDGDCLLVFLASSPVYDIFKKLSTFTKYNCYMKDVDKFIGPFHYSDNPGEEYTKLMSSVGLIEYHVEVRDLHYIYDGVDNLKKNVKAINPFVCRMPIDIQENFLDDYVKCVIGMNLVVNDINEYDNYKFISPYKLIVAYARK